MKKEIINSIERLIELKIAIMLNQVFRKNGQVKNDKKENFEKEIEEIKEDLTINNYEKNKKTS